MTPPTQPPNFAAIDIGTNSFHLIIARMHAHSGRFTILDREKEIVRLGSGSTDMKYISEGAMNRGIHTLRRFKELADAMHAPIRAVATSAVREALNQEIFLRRVKSEAGISVEVVSGYEEARLIYLGHLQALPIFGKKVLMVDIGGGSTEFLIGRGGLASYANSLKLGAVRLTERFFRKEPITEKRVTECRAYIKGLLNPVIRTTRGAGFQIATGSAGTIDSIANMIRYRRGALTIDGRINNFTFSKKELSVVVDDILDATTTETRLELPGLDPARADIITAGALILDQIFDGFKLDTMTVSEYALREGILLDSHRERQHRHHFQHLDDIRYGSVLHVAETLHYDKDHAHQVALLAGKIFDATRRLHKLGRTESEFLEVAALLHDVGFFVSHSQHHRHSYYLIRNSELLGFTENEKEIIANVARYHRKSHPKLKHEGFTRLQPQDQETVVKLASILRIADGLDRTHDRRVKKMQTRITGKTVTFTIHIQKKTSGGDGSIDLWGADQKKKLFEETFRKKVMLKVR